MPSPLANSAVEPIEGTIVLDGDSITYNCSDGYGTKDEEVAQCESSGNFSNPPPECLAGEFTLKLQQIKDKTNRKMSQCEY